MECKNCECKVAEIKKLLEKYGNCDHAEYSCLDCLDDIARVVGAKLATPKASTVRIVDSWMRERGVRAHPSEDNPSEPYWILFEGEPKACRDWIMEGLTHTEGAERDHYVGLLEQLELGLLELDYRRK